MKTALCKVLATMVVAACVCVSTQSKQGPFSISISAPTLAIKSNSEAIVKIILTNTTDHEIRLAKSPSDTQAESQYTIDVYEVNGRPAPETEYLRKLRDKNTLKQWSRVSYTLKPGDSLNDAVVINKLYDISHPGKYTVRVMRKIPPQWGVGIVRSNTVTLTVAQ